MRPQVLYQFPDQAGKHWMPSNGTDGMIWMSEFCERCIHEKFTHTQKDGDLQCEILTQSFLSWPDPIDEWRYDSEGWPICTAWQKWDWGSDDEDPGSNPPPSATAMFSAAINN